MRLEYLGASPQSWNQSRRQCRQYRQYESLHPIGLYEMDDYFHVLHGRRREDSLIIGFELCQGTGRHVV